MTWTNLAYILAAFALVLVNGFFVLAEFAIVKVRATRMEELARQGSRNAAVVRQIIRKMDAYLSATQLGITLASLGLGWIGEPAFARIIAALLPAGWFSSVVSHSISVTAAFIFITFLHIIVGELAPKSVAIRYADRSALVSARPLDLFHKLFTVPLWVLNGASNALLRLIGIPRASDTELAHSEEELRMILGASQQRGVVSLGRLLLIENIFEFGRIVARQVMLPRDKIVYLDVRDPWEVNRDKIRASGHTRFPLCEGSLDQVIGMIHFKDIGIHCMTNGASPPDLRAISREAIFAHENQPIEILMREFKGRRRHMAIVRNAAGKVAGILTLEDVLEELVGNIEDEFDRAKALNLSELIPPSLVFLDFEAEDSRTAIRELVRRVAEAGATIDPRAAVCALLKREASIPCALGEGAALPHARVEGIERPVVALARAVQPIDFDSYDDLPVTLLFLVLSSPRDDATHLGILARIAKLLESDYLRDKLESASSAPDVIGILRVADREISV
jgi:CBS domain containing-hemolysin-like protein